MATMRTYGDGCGIAHALDLVGERWALLVVRELLLGPKRFTDLRDGLPNASPNVLAQRLRELEQAGIVRRRKLPPPAGSWIYELTDWGRELKPIVLSLGTWALRSPSFPERRSRRHRLRHPRPRDVLRRRRRPATPPPAKPPHGESPFHVRVADGGIELDRGPADDPDAIVETDASAFSAWSGTAARSPTRCAPARSRSRATAAPWTA